MTAPSWPESTPIYVPAGAWIRARSLPALTRRSRRPDVGPEWDGAWHATTGDTVVQRFNCRRAKVVCGHTVRASVDRVYDGRPMGDAVVVDELPTTDVCLRCLRLVRPDVAVTVRARVVTIGAGE